MNRETVARWLRSVAVTCGACRTSAGTPPASTPSATISRSSASPCGRRSIPWPISPTRPCASYRRERVGLGPTRLERASRSGGVERQSSAECDQRGAACGMHRDGERADSVRQRRGRARRSRATATTRAGRTRRRRSDQRASAQLAVVGFGRGFGVAVSQRSDESLDIVLGVVEVRRYAKRGPSNRGETVPARERRRHAAEHRSR